MNTFEKDIKLSNAKGILIFLVVFGHLVEIYKDQYYELFVFTYAFHMPLFIFISGYLAKRMKVSKIVNLVFMYIIFQSFFNWILYMTGDHQVLQFTFGVPRFHLWYIVSLVFWYGVVLVINNLKLKTFGKWVVFTLLFSISLISRWYTDDIVGMVREYFSDFSSYTLSFQRTLSFMPFFFAGFFINKLWLKSIYNSLVNKKIPVILFVVTMFLTFLYIQESFGTESLFRGSFGIYRYLEDDHGFLVYLFKMAIHYLMGFWLSYLILNLTTNENNVFAKWGDNSLTIFLFHPVFVFILRQTEFMDSWSPGTKLTAFLLVTIIVMTILGSSFFVKMTKFVCSPYNTFKSIFKRGK